MDLLLRHYQSKKFKVGKTTAICEIQLYEYDYLIHFISDFTFDYLKYENKTQLAIHHGFTINLKNGDIQTYYQLSNYAISEKTFSKSKNNRKKNNFNSIYNLIENAIYRGEKRRGYWGVRYGKSIDKLINILIGKLKPHIESDYIRNKEYDSKYTINPIFDLFVDFHLSKKKIKPHDSVYHTIQHEYPKPKWLKENENKFLPAVLDSYGIKSKYLISEINKKPELDINLHTVSYVCKLFGDGYVDYLRRMDWFDLVSHGIDVRKKYHTLRNDAEKNCMVKLVNDWNINQTIVHIDNLIDVVVKTLTLRDFLEDKGLKLKFNATTFSDVELLLNKWENLKNHFKKGYKIRYTFPEDMIQNVESDIFIGQEKFTVRILKTQEDFFTEGFIMKNCMSKQFNKGIVFLYISMKNKKTRINLEYKNGILITSFGKANTPVDKGFVDAINTLNKRVLNFVDYKWEKEKYDFIEK